MYNIYTQQMHNGGWLIEANMINDPQGMTIELSSKKIFEVAIRIILDASAKGILILLMGLHLHHLKPEELVYKPI